MQFLGVGWQELMVVLLLAFIVIGPERMPQVAYQIGRAVKTLQGYARAVRDEFGGEIDYINEQYRTVRGELDSAKREFREQQQKFEAEMREATASVQAAGQELSNVVNFSDRQPLPLPSPESALDPTAYPVTDPSPAYLPPPPAPPAPGPTLVF